MLISWPVHLRSRMDSSRVLGLPRVRGGVVLRGCQRCQWGWEVACAGPGSTSDQSRALSQ